MDGLTKADLDKAESRELVPGNKPMRPRDAATLIMLDRQADDFLVLVGRRHHRHAFMPGKFVFPGGRTDIADSRVAVATTLHPKEEAKLVTAGSKITAARARAIAVSAIRETYEEAGLLIGEKRPFKSARADWQGFVDNGVCPSLKPLRFIARAITPPGRVRRYDTRFLSAWKSDVAVALPDGGPTNELEELIWLPISEAKQADVPLITRTILEDLENRLAHDPELRPGGAVPFYRMHRNHFLRDLL